jgi:16S rRNA (cytidine1402-2'-O)-methyltransferase
MENRLTANSGAGNSQNCLYLFPLPISEDSGSRDYLGNGLRKLLLETKLIFAENERTARRFISSLKLGIRLEEIHIERFDKDSDASEANRLVTLLIGKGPALLMSEAGCPGIADPGAVLVDACHKLGVRVVPLVGPSSILLALMGSGFSGQNFAFHGYLPVDKSECSKKIRQLETDSLKEKRTQIFIETPYRNASVWERLLDSLKPETGLCYAFGIGSEEEEIIQKKVSEWKKGPGPEWKKIPAVFLFMAH